ELFLRENARRRGMGAGLVWGREGLTGEDGRGAISPAMANSVMMFEVLGFPKDQEEVQLARRSIDKLLVVKADEAYCQPCVSPVWDTVLACHALLEAGAEGGAGGQGEGSGGQGGGGICARAVRGLRWLERAQGP